MLRFLVIYGKEFERRRDDGPEPNRRKISVEIYPMVKSHPLRKFKLNIFLIFNLNSYGPRQSNCPDPPDKIGSKFAYNMYKSTKVIAEVKTQSPFGFKSEKNWDELFSIANRIGDIVSVHTDFRWGGSFELIKKAKLFTNKPILAKGIYATDVEIKRAIDVGADYVLVVGRIPAIYLNKCLIEPLTLTELKTIPENFKVVWNSRDLSDGRIKKETFEEARKIFRGWLCQASNIKTVDNIKKGADAVLVGTHLAEFAESLRNNNT